MALVSFSFDASLSQLGSNGLLPPTCPFCLPKPTGQAVGQRGMPAAHHRCLQGLTALGLSLAAHPSGVSFPSLGWNLNSCL